MLSQNGPDFWFPGGAGHWQKDCQRCSFFTYQILAQIAWSDFLSSVLLPRNRKKGRCCHKMARISGFQVALGQKCPIVRDVPSSTYQILAQIAWSVNFLSSVLLPRNRKKGRCCHKMARISGFQVALGIDKNVRLSEMFLLPHTKFWPKLHGPLIFYLVFSFPGTGKRVDAVTKWPGFLVSRWRWALTKMSDCQRCSFFTYQILAQIAWSVNFLSSVLLPRNRKKVGCWFLALTKMSDCQRCSFFDIPNFGPNCMVR